MFVDTVTITIKAGNGGNGAVSFLRNARTRRGGPDGGNGGNGGDIFVQGVNDITALSQFRFKKVIAAEEGVSGKKKNLFGRNGEGTTFLAPIGTTITDKKTSETFEISDSTTKILIAKGGKGGRGNNEFKSSTNQAPKYAEKGTLGEEKVIFMELKLSADIGLIGLPNTGKSSLLKSITRASPKIGDYPFTTLEPNIGMLDNVSIADIPGLIEGASNGRGLGIAFLRHIEKTKLLVHCIDCTQEYLTASYLTVRKELAEYNKSMLNKPEIIVLTKTDLLDFPTLSRKIREIKKMGKEVYSVSILDDKSIEDLKSVFKNFATTHIAPAASPI